MKRIFLLTLLTFAFTGFAWSQGDGSIMRGERSVNENALQQNQTYEDGVKLFIPNAFTPNGDGLNDEFVIPTVDLERFEIVIYNRMGSEIYRSDNPNTSWTGYYQGREVPEGAYVYVVRYKWLNHGEEFKREGTVTVIR